MKRSKQNSSRAMRHGGITRPDNLGDSRYARKAKSGRQMYGDGSRPGRGCCANSHLFGVAK